MDLSPPAVPAQRYDADYFLNRCAGREAWVASDGADVDPLYAGCLIKAQLRPGDVVLDIGTGRGELPAVAVEQGAALGIGIDYADSALALARRTVNATHQRDKVLLLAADARRLPIPDHTVDLVTMLDVVEHLTPVELDHCLREAARVLKPGGRLLSHTAPNRLVYDLTYRLQRSITPTRRRSWPTNPRNQDEIDMHVNEQTARSLRTALVSAGFDGVSVYHGLWVWEGFVPEPRARKLYHRLARFRLTSALGAGDIWGEARAPV